MLFAISIDFFFDVSSRLYQVYVSLLKYQLSTVKKYFTLQNNYLDDFSYIAM